jgi:hypothetical protein
MNAERRKSPRTKVEALAYINFEPNNGGIVLNVSEEGLGFHAVTPVQQTGTLHFWFSAEGHRVEAAGELAWTDETRKTGGLRFAVLPAEVREQVRVWMDQCTMVPAAEQTVGRFSAVTRQNVLAAGLSAERSAASFSADSFSPSWADTSAGWPELEPELASSLADPAPEIHAPMPLDGPARSKALQARYVKSARHAWQPSTKFLRGVATGLLMAAFVATAFSFHAYRREFGESLILLGERFGARPSAPVAAGATAIPLKGAENTPSGVSLGGSSGLTSPGSSSVQAKTDRTQQTSPELDALRDGISPTLPITSSAAASGALSAVPLSSEVVPSERGREEQPEPAAIPATDPASNLAADAQPAEIKSVSRATDSAGERKTPGFDSPPGKYLEVGAFRRKVSADRATKTVNELGMDPIVVRKSDIWLNFYHVLAGPYRSASETEAARSMLASRGFKPRTLPSRSRRFALPKMTIYGTDASVTNCTITWDLYSPDATVTFTKGGTAVATAQGKWVKRGTPYKTNAVLDRSNDRGLRTLLEIQFHGMDQVLVFGESEALRYFTPPPDVGL